MSNPRKTWLLLAIAAVLAVLNLIGNAAPVAASLPSLAAVAPDMVTRVRIYSPIEEVILTRTASEPGRPENDKWRITSPLDFAADAAQVRSLLRVFGPGVPMEARVDVGNLEDYGVDDQHGKLIELYATDDEPAVAVVIGKAAAGTSSFVRLPGSEDVFRADLGGRSRFDKPAADWRDKLAFDVDKDAVTAIALTRGTETLRFRRGPGRPVGAEGKEIPGDWTMDDAPFAVDSAGIDAIARAVTRIRAGEIHNAEYPGDFEHPQAVAVLTMRDGSTHTVVVGGASDATASILRVDDRAEVYRASTQVRRQLTQPLSGLRDRALFDFQRKDVASVALAEGSLTIVLSQGEGDVWAITQPPNMDVDQKQALFTVNTLAALRAASFAPDAAFSPTGSRFLITMQDGSTHSLDVGQTEKDADGQPIVRVRVSGKPELVQIKGTTLTELKKAFGRG